MRLGKRTGRRQVHTVGGDIVLAIFLVIVGVFMFLPFIYSIVQSLKPMEELFVFPPKFFVRNPTLSNFKDLLLHTNNMWVPLERYIFNSFFVSVAGTVGSVIIGSMAAYPLAKFRFPGSALYEKIIVLSLLFVYNVTAVPQFIIMSKLKMVDTLWAVLLPSMASSLSLYLMKNFMSQLPDDLIEAAKIDGAGHMKIFLGIVMPNVKPAWVTAVIFVFQGLWNMQTDSYIFTESLKNLPTLLMQISTGTVATAGISAAASVILMLPPIIVFLISESQVVETMAHSGIKG
ncbi:MAG: carbohydrate ABC transporter permease [Clostridia bacterium]|nr:carbohydrate ABC transporter permease [Clostridia bacterium]